MIVDFTLSNFRSIRKKQTFSFFAESSSNHLADNIAKPGDGKIAIHRTAGVYGANASGKSNLLMAFNALKYIVCSSGDLKDGEKIPCYEPYLLSDSSKNSPVEFEIEFFSKNNKRYLYSVSFSSKRIISESLDYYPSRSKANIFRREEGDSWEDVSFGGHYTGGKKKFAFFDNNSYISKAGNSADAPELIRSIFNHFRKNILLLGVNQRVSNSSWREDLDIVRTVSSILSKVDTGITDISFKETDISNINFGFPDDMPDSLKKQIIDSETFRPVFSHRGKGDIRVEFTEEMESSGTIKLFNMFPVLINALKNGSTILMDELDNSFHPHIAELIIKLFNDPNINKHNAQLIFSTHNVNLMSPELLRRDQIWLTEKKHGETSFYSLEEFDKKSVKIDSPFSKWYSEGRFDAIPSIDIGAISEQIIKMVS
jgi:hypothetical protein